MSPRQNTDSKFINDVLGLSTEPVNDRTENKNSGYVVDPTGNYVAKKIDKQKYNNRARDLIKGIRYICAAAGFEIEGRIVLIDKKTGRVWY